MTSRKPDVEYDGLYSQAQAACALNVDRHTIRRYELNGYLRFKIRKAGMRKVTTGSEILRCWKNTYC